MKRAQYAPRARTRSPLRDVLNGIDCAHSSVGRRSQQGGECAGFKAWTAKDNYDMNHDKAGIKIIVLNLT